MGLPPKVQARAQLFNLKRNLTASLTCPSNVFTLVYKKIWKTFSFPIP